MASFFGQRGTTTNPTPPATALRVQSSVQGKPLAIGWGQGRVSGNLIWYGDFAAIPHNNASGGGGKGAGAGGGKGSAGNVSYTYQVAVAIAICEGPISSILSVWNNKSEQTLASVNLAAFLGSYVQTAWGYLTSLHPADAYNFRGLAYVAAGPMDLGTSQEVPNLNYEVKFAVCDAIAGAPDADPRDVIIDALTNPHYGAGYPSGSIGSLDIYSAYCRATGMVISPIITTQSEASRLLADILAATNSEAVHSGGILNIVPRGDQNITANGSTYTAPAAPEYDIDDDSLLPSNSSGPPIKIARSAQQDRPNWVSVEYLDRTNDYNPVSIDAKDDASITVFGERPAVQEQRHMFALADAAQMSASLELGRLQIGTRYEFRLPPRFVRLDPMDIITLTRPSQGLSRKWVRIVEIQEADDLSLSITAEEYLGGSGAAPIYGKQASTGYVPDYNVAPGPVNAPIIFEPTDQLAGGLFVDAAVSGSETDVWGGANVFASYDNETYQFIGRILGPARTGTLTAIMPTFPVNPTGVTIDQTNTLSVNLAECAGSLISGSQADVLAFNTLCRVGDELIAYRDAALTSANNYDLTYFARGIYGTEANIAAHPIGTRFARLDQGVISIPYDQSRVGSTIYIKFCSFNVWGGGNEQIADVPAYPYTITGVALTSPLPTVQNVRTVFEAGFQKIWWDDVSDFRTGIRYKIYRGDTYAGAQQVADQAHPPFIAFGAGTYWIVAYAQPVPDLFVYSEDPVSVTIAGNMLVQNLVHQSNQQTDGWPGIFSNGVAKSGPNIALGGGGDILGVADFLAVADVLNYGGVIASGTYEIRSQDYVDAGYVADLYVNATWKVAGVPVGQNILTVPDFLNMPDVLGSASTQYVNATLQIATAQIATPGNLYDATDLYAISPDLYGYGIAWSGWTDFVPGVYRAQLVKFRLVLTTIDSQTICTVLEFSYEVSVPPRIDHYQDFDVPNTGITVTFIPDDASVDAPFNGGVPLGSTTTNNPLPFVNFSLINQPGLHPVIDSLTLAAITFHFEDGVGTHTAVAGVNMQVEGY